MVSPLSVCIFTCARELLCVCTVNDRERCCNPSGKMLTLVDRGMMQVCESSLSHTHTPQQQSETLKTVATSHKLHFWDIFIMLMLIICFHLTKTDLEKLRLSEWLLINRMLVLHSNPCSCISWKQTIVTNIFFMSSSECCGKAWRMMSSKEEETLCFFQYVEENGLRAYNGLVAQNLDHTRNERNRTFLQEKNDKKRKQEEAIKR